MVSYPIYKSAVALHAAASAESYSSSLDLITSSFWSQSDLDVFSYPPLLLGLNCGADFSLLPEL